MANAAGSLFVRLGLDSSDYTAGLTKAEYEAQQLQIRTVALGTAIGEKLGDAVVETAKALWEMVSSSITAKSKLYDLSIQSGLTVEKLESLRKVGLYSGTSLDEIVGASNRLNRALATSGEFTSGASRAIKALGLDFQSFQKLSPDQQLMTVAKAMNEFEDGTGKGAAAMLLFGRSGAPFLKFLKELAERGEIAGEQTTESAKAAKAFENNLTELGIEIEDLKARLGTLAVPYLVEVTRRFLDAKDATSSWLKALNEATRTGTPEENLKNFRKQLAELQGDLKKNAEEKPADNWVQNLFGRSTKEQIETQRSIIESNIKYLEQQIEVWEKAKQRSIRLAGQEGAGAGRGMLGYENVPKGPERLKSLTGLSVDVTPKKSEVEKYIEALQNRIDKTKELTAVEQLQADIAEGKLKGMTASQLSLVKAKAQELDVANRGVEQRKAEAQQEKEWHDWVKKGNDALIERARSELAEIDAMKKVNQSLREDIEMIGLDAESRTALENQRLQNIIDIKEEDMARRSEKEGYEAYNEQLAREIQQLKERQSLNTRKQDILNFEDMKKATEEANKEAERLQESMAESIANGILDGFRRGGSFAEVFINELKAQFAKAILTPIIKPIVVAEDNFLKSIIGSIGNFLFGSSGFGSIPGGYTEGGVTYNNPSAYIGHASGGGPVSAWDIRKVNELRTEALRLNGQQYLLMGDQGGTVDSAPRLGQSVTVNQVNNIGQGVTRNELINAMMLVREQTKADIRRSRRNGVMT